MGSVVDKNGHFALFLSTLRTARVFLESAVDKNGHFALFLSTLRSARAFFGVDGRQKTVILLRFCLHCGSRALDLAV